MAEVAWHQTGLEPGDEGVDAEHRQPQPLGESASVRHHIGAFEQNRADIGVARDKRVAGGKDVALGRSNVEPLLVIDHDTGELAAVVGADDRGGRIGACGDQVLLSEICGADRDDPTRLPGGITCSINGICIKLEVATGTPTCADISRR